MKWKLSLVVVVVAAVTGALIIYRRLPPPAADVLGRLPTAEQLQIRQGLRREMWRQVFLYLRQGNLARVPQRIRDVATGRIQEVEILPHHLMQVRTTSRTGDGYYLLENPNGPVGTSDWRVLRYSPAPFGASFESIALPSLPKVDAAVVAAGKIFDEIEGRSPSTKLPSVSTEAQFATSLSNRTGLSLGR